MRGVKPQLRAIEGGLSKVPAAPAGLNSSAREEFRRAAQDMLDLKLLTKSDIPALGQLANARAMVKKLRPMADKADPIIVNEKTGATKQHPAYVMLEKFMSLCLRYEGELGLTPAARARKGFQQQGSKADEGAPAWLDL